MTSVRMIQREIHDDARLMVNLEQNARQAMLDGNLQEVSELWMKREVVRVRRSYLMRMLWSTQGIPE